MLLTQKQAIAAQSFFKKISGVNKTVHCRKISLKQKSKHNICFELTLDHSKMFNLQNSEPIIAFQISLELSFFFLLVPSPLHCIFCWLYKDKWVADPILCFFIERVASKIVAKISNGFFLPLLVLVPNLRFNLPWYARCTKIWATKL